MKKIIVILISVTLFNYSCSKEKGKGVVIETYMDISYLDKSGRDLLDSKTPGYYSPDNIHVYKMVDGVKKKVDNPMMDYLQDYLIYKESEDSVHYLRIFLDNPTYIQLNQTTTDTITCEIENTNGNRLLKKFWNNGVCYWGDKANPKVITIIK